MHPPNYAIHPSFELHAVHPNKVRKFTPPFSVKPNRALIKQLNKTRIKQLSFHYNRIFRCCLLRDSPIVIPPVPPYPRFYRLSYPIGSKLYLSLPIFEIYIYIYILISGINSTGEYRWRFAVSPE